MSTKKTPDEWVAESGILIMDPDGWDRRNFAEDWARPITRAEFRDKVWASTIDVSHAKPGWSL